MTKVMTPITDTASGTGVGKTVKAGDTLFIVEAMKTMNPITAPHGGTVKEICVSDKDPVEFGTALCVIA